MFFNITKLFPQSIALIKAPILLKRRMILLKRFLRFLEDAFLVIPAFNKHVVAGSIRTDRKISSILVVMPLGGLPQSLKLQVSSSEYLIQFTSFNLWVQNLHSVSTYGYISEKQK
jgi:hypothetical protein